MWETNSSFRCTAAPFFGRRPLPGLRGPGFSNAVQDFFALVTISMRTSPLPLSSLSFSSAGTVRKYLSGRSRESPKVRAAREASSTICITWEAAETEASFHSPAAFRPSWSRILKGMHAQPQTLSARMPRPPNICPWMYSSFAEFSDSWKSFFTPGFHVLLWTASHRLLQGHGSCLPYKAGRTFLQQRTSEDACFLVTRSLPGKNGSWMHNSPG